MNTIKEADFPSRNNKRYKAAGKAKTIFQTTNPEWSIVLHPSPKKGK